MYTEKSAKSKSFLMGFPNDL